MTHLDRIFAQAASLPRPNQNLDWPLLKIIQPMSPEFRFPGTVYLPGDMMLPYWTVRKPAALTITIVGVTATWDRWRDRHFGGGFLGSHDAAPPPEVGVDVVPTGTIYADTEYHGRTAIRFVGPRLYDPLKGIGTTFADLVAEVAAHNLTFDVTSLRLEPPGHVWFSTEFTRNEASR